MGHSLVDSQADFSLLKDLPPQKRFELAERWLHELSPYPEKIAEFECRLKDL